MRNSEKFFVRARLPGVLTTTCDRIEIEGAGAMFAEDRLTR